MCLLIFLNIYIFENAVDPFVICAHEEDDCLFDSYLNLEIDIL